MRAPPVLLVDFLHGGPGSVILRRKGSKARLDELKPHLQSLIDLQHVTLSERMAVWLTDLDGDISGADGRPVPAIIRWSDQSGWYAEFDSEKVISNFP